MQYVKNFNNDNQRKNICNIRDKELIFIKYEELYK